MLSWSCLHCITHTELLFFSSVISCYLDLIVFGSQFEIEMLSVLIHDTLYLTIFEHFQFVE